jgi:hypothetical protein
MPSFEFKPKISAGEQPQTHGLDRAATGTGKENITSGNYCVLFGITHQHYALIIIPLFITQTPTCFGTYVPSSGSVLYP